MNDSHEVVDVEHEVVDVEIDEPMIDDVQVEKTSPEEDMEWKDRVTAREVVENEPLPWLKAEEIEKLKSRWNSIQIEFVDDPNSSVKQADDLVAEAVERFEQALYNQRTELVEQWNNQDDISTEDLRIALQSYRSFLDRLLTINFSGS